MRSDYAAAVVPSMRLTRRQAQVLAALAEGLSYRGAGKLLGISVCTVGIHGTHIRAALGAANATEAVAIAIRAHLIL
jgi:DNA-binding NarL/FixJ family response regulator